VSESNVPERRAPGARWWASPRTGGMAALALAIALAPLALVNDYFYDIAILVGLNAIVCIGLNLLIGYAGQISLGHAGFFGLGAYGSALLASRYGLPPLAALAATTAAVALMAWVVGRPILRLKGHTIWRWPRSAWASSSRSSSPTRTRSPAGPTACRCRR